MEIDWLKLKLVDSVVVITSSAPGNSGSAPGNTGSKAGNTVAEVEPINKESPAQVASTAHVESAHEV